MVLAMDGDEVVDQDTDREDLDANILLALRSQK
jgi:hypothetical protein